MLMKKILLGATTAIILLTLACRKDFNKEEIPDEKTAFITEAKNSFYNLTKLNTNAINAEGYFTNATSDKNNKPVINPLWRFSVVEKSGKNTFIEIPILVPKKQITLYNFFKEPVSDIINLERLNNSFQRLLTYKTNENKFHEIILTYIPSYNYIKEHSSDISKLKINNINEKKFTGYVEYRTIAGVKIFTLIFKNGKLVKRLLATKSTSNNLKVTSSDIKTMETVCDWVSIPQYSRVCVFVGDPLVEYCGEWEYYGDEYNFVCSDIPDPGNPDPEEPTNPCDVPDNFYLCNPDNPTDPPTEPEIQDIINNITDPCLKAMVETSINGNLKNEISSTINSAFGSNPDLDLVFFNDSFPINLDGTSMATGNLNSFCKIEITLNTSLNASTKEYIAATIIHEALHAFITLSETTNGSNNTNSHELLALSANFEKMVLALKEMYPNLSDSDARDLTWGGLGATQGYSQLSQSDKNRISTTNNSFKNGTKGTKC